MHARKPQITRAITSSCDITDSVLVCRPIRRCRSDGQRPTSVRPAGLSHPEHSSTHSWLTRKVQEPVARYRAAHHAAWRLANQAAYCWASAPTGVHMRLLAAVCRPLCAGYSAR